MTVKFKKIHESKIPFSKFGFKKLKGVVEKLSLEIVLEAKAVHRFTSRSNNLERSVKNTISTTPKSITSNFKLDERIANYGKYIHRGFRSWKPDPFLKNAIDNKVKLLKRLIRLKMKAMK